MASSTKLVGAQEIGALLGVSRQRVQQLIQRPGFPEPYDTLAMGKVWRLNDVARWAEQTGRTIAIPGEEDRA